MPSFIHQLHDKQNYSDKNVEQSLPISWVAQRNSEQKHLDLAQVAEHGNSQQRVAQLQAKANESRVVQRMPGILGFRGPDANFARNVLDMEFQPDPATGIRFSVDKSGAYRGNILFTVPFNNYKCQIHIHYTPDGSSYKVDSKIGTGDTARAHIYNNGQSNAVYVFNGADSLKLIEHCVPPEKVKEAKAARDIELYGKRTHRSLTGMEMAMRGDHY
ncbi:MAG: hypothetical protein EP338_13715 [Bacteroidetes bacterium]|nr:MAG: hypothetical protein EP338_13715 [Bacteroidota bacterium]